MTVWRNVCKYRQHSTSLNRNKGNSGRIKTGRSEENIEAVAQQLENNPHVSSRRNRLSLNLITRLDLRWHPYQINVQHKLKDNDYPRRLQFC